VAIVVVIIVVVVVFGTDAVLVALTLLIAVLALLGVVALLVRVVPEKYNKSPDLSQLRCACACVRVHSYPLPSA
jgi:uncharacterized membrane protein YdfJ with MMPL/SSD domain